MIRKMVRSFALCLLFGTMVASVLAAETPKAGDAALRVTYYYLPG